MDKKVYIANETGNIYCLALPRGKEIWHRYGTDRCQYDVAVENQRAFVSNSSGNLVCVDAASGSEIWKAEHSGLIFTTPVVSANKVFYGSDDGCLYGLCIETGDLVFRFAAKKAISPPPAIYGDRVVFGSDDYNIYCVNLETENAEWFHQSKFWVRSEPIIKSYAVERKIKIYVGLWHEMTCLDLDTGETNWNYWCDGELNCHVLIQSGVVICCDDAGNVYGFDESNGSLRWKISIGDGQVHSPCLFGEKHAIVSCGDVVSLLAIQSGTLLDAIRMPSSVMEKCAVVNSYALIPCEDGVLYCASTTQFQTDQ